MARKTRKLATHDIHAATELELYADNDEPLYLMRQAIETRQAFFIARGTWRRARSVTGFRHLADEAARRYRREFGTRDSVIFTVAERNAVARSLTLDFVRRLRGLKRRGIQDLPEAAEAKLRACGYVAGGAK